MSDYTQTKEELLAHLKEQLSFIKQSSVSFDDGFEGEGKRLAVVIRVLLHDTSKSISLLTLLNKKNIRFYDSASPYDSRSFAPYTALTMMGFSSQLGGWYAALLDDGPHESSKTRKLPFNAWWKGMFVIKDKDGKTFARKDLVLAVANKEGGAHIDPKLDQPYANLSRFNSLGWKVFRSGEEKDFNNTPILPSIRQIAHEVIKTLRDEALDLFPDDDTVFEIFNEYERHCNSYSLRRFHGAA